MLVLLLAALLMCGCSSDQPLPKEEQTAKNMFIGNWRVFNDAGDQFYIAIKEDGTASSTWGTGEVGTWKVIDSKILLTWNTGWQDILVSENGRFKKISFEPGSSTLETPTSTSKAERVDKIPN